jgi:hypothetical protein
MARKRNWTKATRKTKYTKKKSYGQAHVGQEWNSSDENSKSESDNLSTIAIKQVTLPQDLKAHMPHGKGKQKKG